VHVHIKPEAIKPIEAVYAPMQRKMFGLWSTFSERDLRVIAEFISRSLELSVECIEEISRHAPAPSKRRVARGRRASS
jgi:hypothetical protein